MVFSILLLAKRSAKSPYPTGTAVLTDDQQIVGRGSFFPFRLDLDAWINDPPSESEDEAVPSNGRYENHQQDRSLFSGDQGDSYYHGSHLDTHGSGDSSSYSKSKTYVEPSAQELVQQRETRKQSEKLNPFYLKDSSKAKATPNVRRIPCSWWSNIHHSFFAAWSHVNDDQLRGSTSLGILQRFHSS